MKKSTKYKTPQWFQDLYDKIEKERKDLFECLSESIGYNQEWCKQNIEKCLERLGPEERRWARERLIKIDIMIQYAWSRLYYENWDEVKDSINMKPPEYNLRKKIIEFSRPNIFNKILVRVKKFKKSIRDKCHFF